MNRTEAERVLQQLAKLEFTEAAGDFDGAGWWRNTVRGNALANATTAKQVRRFTADRAVQQLSGRVRTVNCDLYFLYVVTRVVLFGSYLLDSQTVNDVDVGIELRPRARDQDCQNHLEEARIAAATRSGKRFRNISEEMFWPQTDVWLRLKPRSRTLSLNDLRGEARIIEKRPLARGLSA